MKLEPYVTFKGNCAEALEFYKNSLNGEIKGISYYRDAPMKISDDYKDKILNATFRFGDCEFMASDSMPMTSVDIGSNISLSIDLDKTEAVDRYFKNLSEGGKITLPLQETFWGAKFGMLTDKYGINWMFNCTIKKQELKILINKNPE